MASGQLELQTESFDVADLLECGRDACLAAALQQGHALALLPSATPLQIVADRLRLLQTLQSLLGNAIQFTPPGGRIELHALLQGDDAVRIAVQDNGIGIAENEQALVFQDFGQVSPGAERAPAGLRLGLALARQIAQAHGGCIELQSTPGQGSCFAVVLPLQGPSP